MKKHSPMKANVHQTTFGNFVIMGPDRVWLVDVKEVDGEVVGDLLTEPIEGAAAREIIERINEGADVDTGSEEFLMLLRELQAVEDEHPEWDRYAADREAAAAKGQYNCAPTGAWQETYRRIKNKESD